MLLRRQVACCLTCAARQKCSCRRLFSRPALRPPATFRALPVQGAFGTASHELGVPMSYQLRMPIASNTKLMTSVALHQLQEQVR